MRLVPGLLGYKQTRKQMPPRVKKRTADALQARAGPAAHGDLIVPGNFDKLLGRAFEQNDALRRETLAMVFGDGRRVTDIVVPGQITTETSCVCTVDGEIDISNWHSDHPASIIMGWVHSHHILPLTPSVVDISQQFRHQSLKCDFQIVMLIRNLNDGLKAFLVTQTAMTHLDSSGGVVPDGEDTMSLIEEVNIVMDDGDPATLWGRQGSCQDVYDLTAKLNELETQVTRQTTAIEDLRHDVKMLRQELETQVTRQATAIEDLTHDVQILREELERAKIQRDGEEQQNMLTDLKRGKKRRQIDQIGAGTSSEAVPPNVFNMFFKKIAGELHGDAASRAKAAGSRWKALPKAEREQIKSEYEELKNKRSAQPRPAVASGPGCPQPAASTVEHSLAVFSA